MTARNQAVAFADITDQPHTGLLDAAIEATAGMYDWPAASE